MLAVSGGRQRGPSVDRVRNIVATIIDVMGD